MAASNPPDEPRAPIALIDLKAQQDRIRPQLDAAIASVLDSGAYIMGPQVAAFEKELSDFCGAKHAISCSSGTDALLMVLMAQGIGPGDAVICPGFTYTATPEVIALLGATGVFVDVHEDSFNIDADLLDDAVTSATARGLTVKAIIPVDLFGQPADYAAIMPFAEKHGLFVLADAAQSFGASSSGRNVGQFGHATATSFFPAKPLGCYGDGGAVFTDDDALADAVRSIRLHGKGADKYDVVRVGINGRLDTLQAAILIEKLKIFADEIASRNAVAKRYSTAFDGRLPVPIISDDNTSVWAQYTLRLPAASRDDIAKKLREKGIPTAVYYPRPLHHQPAYASHIVPTRDLIIAERLSRQVLSLPMHPYLSQEQQDFIIEGVLETMASESPPPEPAPLTS